MAREKKAKNDNQQNPVSIDMAKLTEGIHLVFSGAVKMLEAMAYTVPVDSSFTANSITDSSSAIDTVSAVNHIDSDKPKTDMTVDKLPQGQQQEPPQELPTEIKAETKAEQKKTPQEEQKNEPQESKGNTEKSAVSVTPNDITRIIVRKIKQNKENNEKILMILKTYGVEKVSDLKPEKYEAFVTDLAAL